MVNKFYFAIGRFLVHMLWYFSFHLGIQTWDEIEQSISTGDPAMDETINEIMDEIFK